MVRLGLRLALQNVIMTRVSMISKMWVKLGFPCGPGMRVRVSVRVRVILGSPWRSHAWVRVAM